METLTLARGATLDFNVWWWWKDHDGLVHEFVSCPKCGWANRHQGKGSGTLKCSDCGKTTDIVLEGYASHPH